MRTTSAFISGMATMGVLAGGIAIGTGAAGALVAGQGNNQGDGGSNTASTGGNNSGNNANAGNTGNAQSATAKDGTYDGSVVQTPYGPMQVEIVIKNGKIDSATCLQHPGGDPTSTSINSQVVPILTKATVDYQSVNFGNVSRATISSSSYRQSAQAALDKAGFTG